MKLTLTQIRRLLLFIYFALLFVGIGYWLGQREVTLQIKGLKPEVKIERTVPYSREKIDFNLFWDVWDRLSRTYLQRKDLDQGKMIYGAISGMVASLGDPYTVFLPPAENKQSKEDLSGAFEGVGIQLGYKNNRLAVVAPLAGMPAEKAGVKAGDLILRIVDEKKRIDRETTGISLPEAVSLIRGLGGTSVKLTFSREGVAEPFTLELRRETIVVKSVELKFIEKEGKRVAHLKLMRFGERTAREWEEAINQIKNERLKIENYRGIILDVRNNPGGFLDGSVFIVSEFLADGVVVQQDKGADGKEIYSVNRKGDLYEDPLVVLINEGSASASEIVAGALKERRKGVKLIGLKTFGKGTVQEAQDLSNGAGLHITVARWLLPSGKSIDKEGIKPDIEVKMDEKDETKDPQLDKAVEILTLRRHAQMFSIGEE
jgi:carboxyl-terminal processing protease